jgi:hypothetical protein
MVAAVSRLPQRYETEGQIPKMIATKKCPNCGLDNQADRSICANCTVPLTAYGKEVGMADAFDRRLAKQVEALDARPPIITVVTIFMGLLALVPLARVIGQFRHHAPADPENVNAISTAFAAIGPIFYAVTLIPITIALGALAYFTWTQRPWTWMVNLVVLGISAVVMFINYHFHLPTFLWLVLVGVFAFFWTRPRTRSWFALT